MEEAEIGPIFKIPVGPVLPHGHRHLYRKLSLMRATAPSEQRPRNTE